MTATTTTGSGVNADRTLTAKDAPTAGTDSPAGVPAPLPAHTSAPTSVARPARGVRAEEGEAEARTPTKLALVVGLDLSLVSTGVAHLSAAGHVEETIEAGGRGVVRLRRIAARVKSLCSGATLVVVEGPAYSRQAQSGHHEGAGLWWLVQDRLLVAERPVAVAPPTSLKTYALGKGGGKGTDKAAMVVAARDRLGYDGVQADEADALWLAAMGLAWLTGEHPVPRSHRRGLDGCEWPA